MLYAVHHYQLERQLHLFTSEIYELLIYRWSYGIVLYEIFTIGKLFYVFLFFF